PEAMDRLRAAVAKTPLNRPAQPQSQPPQSRVEESRARFGLGSLINRMAGHTSVDPAQSRTRGVPPMTQYDDEADHEQDRTEIPAFLRRQAN
ncbi:MAG: cell division protein FtsZ, partial [Gemmobacter sp.]